MEFQIALMGLAVYLLLWDKLPNWGNWFNTIIAALPQPAQTVYRQWNCAYCSGFWIALGLHGITGLWTIPALEFPQGYMGVMGLLLNVFLDALAGGTLIYVSNMVVKALGLPIVQARIIRENQAWPAALPRAA